MAHHIIMGSTHYFSDLFWQSVAVFTITGISKEISISHPHEKNTKMLCFYMAQGFHSKYEATHCVLQIMEIQFVLIHRFPL